MAVQPENLRDVVTVGAALRIASTQQDVVTFAIGGADKVLVKGTAIAYETTTDTIKEWATGGANGLADVHGIIWPRDVKVLTAGEVLGAIMIRGNAHVGDIISDGGTVAQLKTALRDPLIRNKGLHIDGLDAKG